MLHEMGGLNQPAPSRSPQNTVKNQKKFLDFLKVHNELEKVTKYGTSRHPGLTIHPESKAVKGCSIKTANFEIICQCVNGDKLNKKKLLEAAKNRRNLSFFWKTL